MRPNNMLTFAAVLLAAAALAAPLAAQEQSGEYRLGPRDLVEIRVLEIPELNVERRVDEEGRIDLPMIGRFPVGGLTSGDVRDKLETILRTSYVNRASVSITIREFANKPVAIVGAVQRPGSLNISGKWDLLTAISAAGGLTQHAGKKIFVLRRSSNGNADTLEISVDDLYGPASSTWNVPIYPSDIVNVPPRTEVKVYVLGEVRTPGAHIFSSDDRLTLLSVIAKAGGLAERAGKGVHIRRRTAEGKDEEIAANYNRIVSGREPDPEIRPDDVVIVKASFF